MERTVGRDELTVDTSRDWTYADVVDLEFDRDVVIREVVDGVLYVSPSPAPRHQQVVLELAAALLAHTKARGGTVYVAPLDVWFDDRNVLAPDVLYLAPDAGGRVEAQRVAGPPDLVVEVSSPSTRRHDLVRKRAVYEAFGVAEFWFVDLAADEVQVHVRGEEGYGAPAVVGRGGTLTPVRVPGFSIAVGDLLGPAA